MELKQAAVSIFQAALVAADPARAVQRALRLEGEWLEAGGQRYDLAGVRRLVVIGFGKAGAAMAQGAEAALGERISAGQVTVKYGYTAGLPSLQRVRLHEAGHPLLDENSLAGTRKILDLLAGCGPGDLVVCLVSGGGSALLELPAEGLSLADLRQVNAALLRCGAGIEEVNVLRKHLSQVKGGQLARRANGARILALILSDVLGSPLDSIASGPCVADGSSFGDCLRIVARYGLAHLLPPAVLAHLQAGAAGIVPETPRPGDPMFEGVQNLVVADNSLACQAALHKAAELGFKPLLLTTYLQGEARQAGRVLAAIARQVRRSGQPIPAPACLVAGGETTVTVRGGGLGGRSQELALSAALDLAGLEGVGLLSAGTDGTDGPTDAAGAWADGTTIRRAALVGLSAAASLAENDAYHFFQPLGDLLVTGPTNTNVNDLVILLIE